MVAFYLRFWEMKGKYCQVFSYLYILKQENIVLYLADVLYDC